MTRRVCATICLECLSECGSIIMPLQPTLSSAQVIIVIIIINTPKQPQHNIEHRTTEFRRFLVVVTILIIRRFDSSKDPSGPTPWSLRDVADNRCTV
jgi:hypothetical protein